MVWYEYSNFSECREMLMSPFDALVMLVLVRVILYGRIMNHDK